MIAFLLAGCHYDFSPNIIHVTGRTVNFVFKIPIAPKYIAAPSCNAREGFQFDLRSYMLLRVWSHTFV